MNHQHIDQNLISRFFSGQLPEEETPSFTDALYSCEECNQQLHHYFQENDLIENYVLNKLSPDTRQFFEEHYFGCTTCLIGLQKTERLVTAILETINAELAGFAEKKTPEPSPAAASPISVSRPPVSMRSPSSPLGRFFARYPAITAAAIITLLILIYPAWQGIFELPQLKNTLIHAQRPNTNIEIFSLSEVSELRGAATRSPVFKIPGGGEQEILIFQLSLIGTKAENRYRPQIRNDADSMLWQGFDLKWPGDSRIFTFVSPSVFFEAGDYRVVVQEFTSQGDSIQNHFIFPFTIKRP